MLLAFVLFICCSFGVVLCGGYIQDSQGDQPMADWTFLLKIKIYLSIYLCNSACSKSRDHTLPFRTCYGEVYGNIAREENG